MESLRKKTNMDGEAEKAISRVFDKVKSIQDLFLRNRNSGSTQATMSGLDKADSPLILTGNREIGREIAANNNIRPTDITVISWSSTNITERAVTGGNHEILVDNSFMSRFLDSVRSVIQFLYAEIKRLKKQNQDLREANKRVAKRNTEANKKVKRLKKEQEKLNSRIDTLSEKLRSSQNGRSK